ncbi:MAG: carbamoyltransferase HypF [Bacteroidales bacterium]
MFLVPAIKIHIKGLVQGVGFRPFVYKLAHKHNIKGWVENRNNGVFIHAEAEEPGLKSFSEDLKLLAPPASFIESITVETSENLGYPDFTIKNSENLTNEITGISPDIAVCPDCLYDIKHQQNRILYPFTNCTNCGPRFTIIKDLPYDRDQTTMQPFIMCDFCRTEYEDIMNRRFHAQPVACNQCGPAYQLISGSDTISDFEQILTRLADEIKMGKTIAIKGLGGFNLMCDAFNENAVNKLREIKMRDGKPFAVMFRNLDCIEKYADVNADEKEELVSWQRPIVLLKLKTPAREDRIRIATSVCNNLSTLGAFLPYMPLHYLLFERISTPALVLTSGNISDEPIVISNEEAKNRFSDLVDNILIYNRDIYNRTDDSVARIINNKARIIRRSRGYVPNPVNLNFSVNGILATGAELSNCFAVGKENKAYLSQHIGDLKNLETFEFYQETFTKFLKLFRIEPFCVVADMHPDYYSTRFAEDFSQKNALPLLKVQHHHAHVASCMAENGLDEEVIGVAFDGTGLGTDGHIWGSEFIICNYKSFKRLYHFEYLPLPGGDKSNEEPWRIALSLLYKHYGNKFLSLKLPFLEQVENKKIEMVIKMLENRLNSPLSSGAGRLFDAVAALTSLCIKSSFHAEAPMRLESVINENNSNSYSFVLDKQISFSPMLHEMVKDIQNKEDTGIISAKFHNTIINCIFETVVRISEETGLKKVALSGGVFQNRYILERLEHRFSRNSNVEIFSQKSIPSGDGGLALGQLAIAARQNNYYA